MDAALKSWIKRLNEQNEVLSLVRGNYLLKEACRRSHESKLIRDAMGKSHAEREVNARATAEWLEFSVELARLESAFEHEKLKYEIMDKAFLAEYQSLKLDSHTISRQGA